MMFYQKLGFFVIILQISMAISSFYKGTTIKPFQQPRVLPAQLKYQQMKPSLFQKNFPDRKTALFKKQSCTVPTQKRSFYEMSGSERWAILYGNRCEKFKASRKEITPLEIKERDYKIPLELLLPQNEQERDLFIQNLLRNTINQIDTESYFYSNFTLPIYLVQILASYAANKKNIDKLPAHIDFSSSGWQGVALDAEFFDKESENKVGNFIERIRWMKFPLTKGFWSIFNRTSLVDLTLGNPKYSTSQAMTVLLMFIFEKEVHMARTIIEQRKKYGNYNPVIMKAIEAMLSDIQEKVYNLFERSELTGVYTQNYRKAVPSPIWDILKEYVDAHYFDSKLARIQQHMPDGLDPEYEEMSQHEKKIITEYIKNLRSVIDEFLKQERIF